jgi:adenylate cyclase
LGILPADGDLDDGVVPRVRLAIRLEQSGTPLEVLGQVIAEGGLSVEFVDRAFFRPVGMIDTTYDDLARRLGVSEAFTEAVQVALGVPSLSDEPWVREDDADTMEALAEIVELGVDEAVMISLFQIMAENLRKMARAASEMWSAGVQQPLLESGLTHSQLLEAQSADGARFQALGERITHLLWNRFLEEEIFRGTIETLERALEEAGVAVDKDERLPAIVFLDLTAFTHLTDRGGDEVAAAGARSLVDVVRRTSIPWGGTLVKMLGDGAMLHFPDPAAAVRCSLALVDAIPNAGLPTARFGVNAGPLIVRDVDYFGHTVNVAARLVDYARPGEVLVTPDVVAATESDDLQFTEIGPVSLKGLANPVAIYSAQAAPSRR